jgi:hypothetical protein
MRLPLTLADAKRLAALPPDELAAWLGKCRPRDLLLMDTAFEMWAQQGQLPPHSEGWRVWLMIAGRGFGKTRAGAEWIHGLAMTGSKSIALVGATIDEARRVMVEGTSGLLAVAWRNRVRVSWEPSLGRIKWPKGSVATLFSGDNPDGLRGPEHHVAWGDPEDRGTFMRHSGRPTRRGAARFADDRQLLSSGIGRERRVGRTGGCARLHDRGRVAICRCRRGNAGAGPIKRTGHRSPRRRMGDGNCPGSGSAYRRRKGGRSTSAVHRSSVRRSCYRRRMPDRRLGNYHCLTSAWANRLKTPESRAIMQVAA